MYTTATTGTIWQRSAASTTKSDTVRRKQTRTERMGHSDDPAPAAQGPATSHDPTTQASTQCFSQVSTSHCMVEPSQPGNVTQLISWAISRMAMCPAGWLGPQQNCYFLTGQSQVACSVCNSAKHLLYHTVCKLSMSITCWTELLTFLAAFVLVNESFILSSCSFYTYIFLGNYNHSELSHIKADTYNVCRL